MPESRLFRRYHPQTEKNTMNKVLHLPMNTRMLLFVLLLCMAAMPATAGSVNVYSGGDIQIGGSSGSTITQITTQTTRQIAAVTPVAAVNGSLSVVTTPAEAVVFIDGVRRGISPVTISDLQPGTHALRLEMNGYTGFTALVNVESGKTRYYTTTLVPVTTPLPSAPLSSRPPATKSPGFGAFCGIAALGTVLVIRFGRN